MLSACGGIVADGDIVRLSGNADRGDDAEVDKGDGSDGLRSPAVAQTVAHVRVRVVEQVVKNCTF